VYDASHALARIDANGQNRSALAKGGVGVLEMGLHLGIAQVAGHLPLDVALELAHAPAQPAQVGARVFADLACRRDHLGQCAFERAQVGKRFGESREARRARGVSGQRLAHAARGLERRQQLRELARMSVRPRPSSASSTRRSATPANPGSRP
jgi:hypothetical protein